MLRAFAHYMADYTDDFDIMRHDKAEMQRRVDAMCDSALAVMFVVGAEQVRAEADRDPLADANEADVAVEALREVVEGLDEDERRFLELLGAVQFRTPPIVVVDDIRVINMIEVWRGIARPKMDLTSYGHHTGTGLVDWCGTR